MAEIGAVRDMEAPGEGELLSKTGVVIGTVNGPSRTHQCGDHCRLHNPCCRWYFMTGYDHNGDCPRLRGEL